MAARRHPGSRAAADQGVDRLLEHGPFDVALRAAIAARGLSLERIQDRLSRQGVHVSLATLSYWQSGQRRPERPSSLRVLDYLEGVLEVPRGSLRGLLGPASPRGRRGGQLPGLADLWPARSAVAELLEAVPAIPDAALRRLTLHDRVQVGPDGRERSVLCTQVMRAECNGPDRVLLVCDWKSGKAGDEPIVTRLRNCRLGRVVTSAETSLFAAELLFERPLSRGEAVLIEFEVQNPRREFVEPAVCEAYFRRFRHSVREYLLEVCFDDEAVPRRCLQFTSPPGDGAAETAHCLRLGVSKTVLALGRDFGPGHFGIRWYLDPANSS